VIARNKSLPGRQDSERLVEPERMIQFRPVTVQRSDTGEPRFCGERIVRSARKAGCAFIRRCASINKFAVRKFSLKIRSRFLDGRGKGGADFDPKAKPTSRSCVFVNRL
jgi:hypothetical protein